MTNFTPELIEKAKLTKNAEELLALTKANGVEITEEEAETYFAQLDGAVADDELGAVSGGFHCGNENDSGVDTNDATLNQDIGNKTDNSKYA